MVEVNFGSKLINLRDFEHFFYFLPTVFARNCSCAPYVLPLLQPFFNGFRAGLSSWRQPQCWVLRENPSFLVNFFLQILITVDDVNLLQRQRRRRSLEIFSWQFWLKNPKKLQNINNLFVFVDYFVLKWNFSSYFSCNYIDLQSQTVPQRGFWRSWLGFPTRTIQTPVVETLSSGGKVPLNPRPPVWGLSLSCPPMRGPLKESNFHNTSKGKPHEIPKEAEPKTQEYSRPCIRVSI